MMFTKEEIKRLAKEYAENKSTSEVFRKAHETDFIAGFEKALELIETNKGDICPLYSKLWLG